MLILKENNENWFVLESDYRVMGLDYKDLVEVNRLTREKLVQIERRKSQAIL
jgi:hypothetical protein